jgi:hypothetical protein
MALCAFLSNQSLNASGEKVILLLSVVHKQVTFLRVYCLNHKGLWAGKSSVTHPVVRNAVVWDLAFVFVHFTLGLVAITVLAHNNLENIANKNHEISICGGNNWHNDKR